MAVAANAPQVLQDDIRQLPLLAGQAGEPAGAIVEEQTPLVGDAQIDAALSDSTQVRRVINVRTLHLGPEELLVAAKLEFDASLRFSERAEAIDAAEARVRAVVPSARVMYLEPAIFDPARASGSSPGLG